MAQTTIQTNDIRDLNVTSAKIEKDLSVSGNLIVAGNLTISGTTTTINTENLAIKDNLITLNSGAIGTPNSDIDSGIEVNRGSSANSSIIWDEGEDRWVISHPITIKETSDSPIIDIPQAETNVHIFSIHRLGGYGFDLRYTGVANNTLELWSDNMASGTQVRAFSVGQSGTVSFDKVITFNSDITMAGTSKIDGVDISAHHGNSISNVKHVTDAVLAALAGTSGTAPSNSNKFVDNSDTRLSDSRTPKSHGDGNHTALSYFDTVSDGTNSKVATSGGQNIKFTGSGAATVSVGTLTGYDANVTISSINNYISGTSFAKATEIITYTRAGLSGITTDLSGTWLKLSSTTQQVVSGDLKIAGNLVVDGTTVTMNTSELSVADNIITLNSNVTGTPALNAGIEVNRGALSDVSIIWNETLDKWTLTEDGSTYSRIVTQTFDSSLNIKGPIIIENSSVGGDGGWDDAGLIIKNNHTTAGEAAVSFQNSSTGTNYWITGLNQSADYRMAYGAIFNDAASLLTITSAGKLGIGTIAPLELLHINGSIRGNQSGALRVSTGNGYIDIGPKSSAHANLETDRASFYFNKRIFVNEGIIASYDEDLTLSTNRTEARITVKSDTGNVGIGTTAPDYKLDVLGDSRVTGALRVTSGTSNLVITNNKVTFGNNASIDNTSSTSMDIRGSGTTHIYAGTLSVGNLSLTDSFFGTKTDSEAFNRTIINYADGKIGFGPGVTTRDTWLYRSAANSLKTDGALNVTGKASVGSLRIGTSSTAGYFLKTDASGNASWSEVPHPADKYLSSVTGTAGGTITFAITNGSNVTWNSAHSHSYLPLAGGTLTGDLTINGKLINGNALDSSGSTSIVAQYKNGSGAVHTQFESYNRSAWNQEYVIRLSKSATTTTLVEALRLRSDVSNAYIYGNAAWHSGNLAFGTASTNMATGNHTHANLVAGNGLTGSTYTGGTGYTWSIASHAGNAGSVGTIVVGTTNIGVSLGATSITACAGNDSRLSNDRTPTVHGDDKHNCYAYARISFAPGQSEAVWTHSKAWANYIVQITPNSPETHYYYKNRTTNAVTICLDDEAYEAIDVDVVLIKANTITTTGFSIA